MHPLHHDTRTPLDRAAQDYLRALRAELAAGALDGELQQDAGALHSAALQLLELHRATIAPVLAGVA